MSKLKIPLGFSMENIRNAIFGYEEASGKEPTILLVYRKNLEELQKNHGVTTSLGRNQVYTICGIEVRLRECPTCGEVREKINEIQA